MKIKSFMDVTMRVCFAVLVFFMVMIVTRFLTRQILVEKMGWNNAFTKAVFIGDINMGNAPTVEDENGEASVEVDWGSKYPFKSDKGKTIAVSKRSATLDRYTSLVTTLESKITTYTEDLLIGHMEMTRVGKKYNSLIGCASMPMNSGSDEIIFLNNGYMTYTVDAMEEADLEELSDNVADFSDWLKGQGIAFTYANAGSKICESDMQLPAGETDSINENADELIRLLKEHNVDVLDFRPLQKKQYPDWYSSYYITDHHWKNTTGLWAAGELANHLNEMYGFDFDLKSFDESMYNIETTDNYFLGGQGRGFTSAVVDLEPFSKVTPKFETDLSIQIPTKDINLRGQYSETLFDETLYDSISEYSDTDFETKKDAYGTVRWTNDALGTIENYLTTDNDGKRILMLQDSFGYFLSTYLALDIPNIDLVNLTGFTGSIRTYIEETKPDAVVVLLCEKNIRAIDDETYATHTNYYDFR